MKLVMGGRFLNVGDLVPELPPLTDTLYCLTGNHKPVRVGGQGGRMDKKSFICPQHRVLTILTV